MNDFIELILKYKNNFNKEISKFNNPNKKSKNKKKVKIENTEKKIDNTEQIEKIDNTEKKIEKLIDEYYENEEIFSNSFNDVSFKFLEVIDKIDVSDIKFPTKEFDIIFSGGGFKGYYNFGACEILKKMIQNEQINIRYYTCVSVGAYAAIFLLLGISIHTVRNVYEFARCNANKHDINKIMLKACDKLLPPNAHEICNGKIKILVSKLTFKGMVPVIIDHFESREFLIKVLHATSFVPFLTTKEYNGVSIGDDKFYDGAFVDNFPINKKNDIPQLIFITSSVEYSDIYSFKIVDTCPELLILRGAIEMEKFIRHINNNIESEDKIIKIKDIPIEWILVNNQKFYFKKTHSHEIFKTLINIMLMVSLFYAHLLDLINNNFLVFFKNLIL